MIKNSEKDTTIGIRIDTESKQILERAKSLSGVPISEIIRKGSLHEAQQLIQLFNKRINKRNTSQAEAA